MRCRTCEAEVEEFAHRGQCRPCYNKRMAEYMTKRYYRRRNEFINSRGGRCEFCGSSDRLEIDHINPIDKSFNIGRALSGWAEKRIQEELAKCQVLCYDCHKEKTSNDFLSMGITVPHGGGVSGKRGCSCNLCKKKKSEYMRKFYDSKPKNYCECGVEIDRRGRTKKCRRCNMKEKKDDV